MIYISRINLSIHTTHII